MDIVIGRALLHKDPAERTRLLRNAPKYIHHKDFLAILASIDVTNPNHISRTCHQLAAYNSNEPLWSEVTLWLYS